LGEIGRLFDGRVQGIDPYYSEGGRGAAHGPGE
jgi:hypothetical protein